MNRYLKMLLFVLYDVVALWLSFVVGMLLLRYPIGEVLLEGLWFFIICSVLVVAFIYKRLDSDCISILRHFYRE